MQEITSSHNPQYKSLKQLATSAKHRRRTNQTLVEGVHLCQAYLRHIGAPISCVYGQSALNNLEVAEIIAKCQSLGVSEIQLNDNHFKTVSSVVNGIEILFVAEIPNLIVDKDSELADNSLLLDDIQDPGNLGTILRTASASGITQVYLSSNCSSAWSPKVLRAGMGAHFALNIYENSQLSTLINSSKVAVYATSLEATESIYQHDFAVPSAWLFGNEGQGVSAELLALNVQKVIIPQDDKQESLNVAGAVAVCLFEQRRQRLG